MHTLRCPRRTATFRCGCRCTEVWAGGTGDHDDPIYYFRLWGRCTAHGSLSPLDGPPEGAGTPDVTMDLADVQFDETGQPRTPSRTVAVDGQSQ